MPVQEWQGPTWYEFLQVQLFWPLIFSVVYSAAATALAGPYERLRKSNEGFRTFLYCYIGVPEGTEATRPAFWGFVQVLRMVFALFMTGRWIYLTYQHDAEHSFSDVVAVGACLWFTFHNVLNLLRHGFHPQVLWSFECLVDALTIIPVVFPYTVDFTEVPSNKRWLNLSFLRMHSALMAYFQLVNFNSGSFQVSMFWQVYGFFLRVVSLTVCMAGTILVLELLGEFPGLEDVFFDVDMGQLSFFQMNYWIVTTISTVGYGDFSPTTIPSRMVIIFFIFGGIIFFGSETNRIVEILEAKSQGLGSYQPTSRTMNHLVLTGRGCTQMSSMLETFLLETLDIAYWGGDLDKVPDLVFLSDQEYDSEIRLFVKHSFLHAVQAKVHLLRGDVMKQRDIDRAKLSTAGLAFILPDGFADDHAEEDSRNIMTAMELVKEVPGLRIRLLLLDSSGTDKATMNGIAQTRAVSMSSLKASVFAQSTRVKGILPLMSGLLQGKRSFSEQRMKQLRETSPNDWRLEYNGTLQKTIHGFTVAKRFTGKKFNEVAASVYKESQGEVLVLAAAKDGRLMLNPDMMLEESYTLFAIAQSRAGCQPFEAGTEEDTGQDWRHSFLLSRYHYAAETQEQDVKDVKKREIVRVRRLGSKNATNKDERQRKHVKLEAVQLHIDIQRSKVLLIVLGNEVNTWRDVASFLDCMHGPGEFPVKQPVTVLCDDDPPEGFVDQWDEDEACTFMQGDVFNTKNLIAAGVKDAASIFVMGVGTSKQQLKEDCGRALGDAMTTVLVGYLDNAIGDDKEKEMTQVMLHEFINAQSAMLLSSKKKPSTLLSRAATDEMADEGPQLAVSQKVLDMRTKNMMQAWREGFEAHFLQAFKKSSRLDELRSAEDALILQDCFAAGQAFTNDFFGGLLGHVFKFPATFEFVEALLMPHQRSQTSRLWQVSCPEEWVGKAYGDLVYQLASGKTCEGFGDFRGCAIVVALYRQSRQKGLSEACLGFTSTLPVQTTVLESTDFLTVLAPGSFAEVTLKLKLLHGSKEAPSDSTDDLSSLMQSDSLHL